MPSNPKRQTGGAGPRSKKAGPQRRLIWILALVFVFVAAVHYYLVGPDTLSVGHFDTEFSGTRQARYHALSGLEQRRLREQRELVQELARRYVGSPTTGQSLADLRVIQAIVDSAGLKADQTFELQALGVALGDVLAAQLGLEWIALQDELGRSRALRFGETDVVLFPVTMISKRVEAGLPVSVEELWEKARRTVADARPRA
jgi:hypothetical protein